MSTPAAQPRTSSCRRGRAKFTRADIAAKATARDGIRQTRDFSQAVQRQSPKGLSIVANEAAATMTAPYVRRSTQGMTQAAAR